MRPELEKTNPNASKAEIDKLCKEAWNSLDPEKKSVYTVQAAKLSIEHAQKVCSSY
jgi:hypothetical protein